MYVHSTKLDNTSLSFMDGPALSSSVACRLVLTKLLSANGDGEIRTLDPLLARQVLSQLSYTPRFSVHAKGYEQIYIKYFLFLFNPAATCSPTPSPVQYHRPIRS